jgi:hypothetical protein
MGNSFSLIFIIVAINDKIKVLLYLLENLQTLVTLVLITTYHQHWRLNLHPNQLALLQRHDKVLLSK